MQLITKQGTAVLRRVRDFLLARKLEVAVGALPQHVATLSAIIDRLSAFGVEQDARARAARAATRSKSQLVRTLRDEYLRPIARSAGSVFPDDPVMQRALEMPKFRDAERVTAAALAIADRAREHQARFVAEGFLPDFIERLTAAVEAVRTTIDVRATDLGRRSASTAGQAAEFARGKRVVRLLDAMVTPRLAPQPDLLAEWRTLTRFTRRVTTTVEPAAPAAPVTPTLPPPVPVVDPGRQAA